MRKPATMEISAMHCINRPISRETTKSNTMLQFDLFELGYDFFPNFFPPPPPPEFYEDTGKSENSDSELEEGGD